MAMTVVKSETLRMHLEAIVRGRFEADDAHPWADDAYTPAEYRKHALMALALMDASDIQDAIDNDNADRCRLIPDPS